MKPNHSSTSFCSTKALSQPGRSEGEWSSLGVRVFSEVLFSLSCQNKGDSELQEFRSIRAAWNLATQLNFQTWESIALPEKCLARSCFGSLIPRWTWSVLSSVMVAWFPSCHLPTVVGWGNVNPASELPSYLFHFSMLFREEPTLMVELSIRTPYLQFSWSGNRKLGKPLLL